jgi:hypothetical protein
VCLIVHQPRSQTAPLDLLRSAAEYNPDGFGFMGFRRDFSVHVERHEEVSLDLLQSLSERFAGLDCAWHFRRRTHGSAQTVNLHPFEVIPGLYLMHNGSANVPIRLPGRSDTWHLVHDYLTPLLSHRRRLLYDATFRQILEQWLGPKNRLVVLDEQEGRINVLIPSEGVEWQGLWLSNSRWLDREELGVPDDGRDEQVLRGTDVHFC